MKYDELAFFNQQLAAMLRDGMPLEGALRRLCEDMRAGPLRSELQALEAELAKGTPMAEDSKKPHKMIWMLCHRLWCSRGASFCSGTAAKAVYKAFATWCGAGK